MKKYALLVGSEDGHCFQTLREGEEKDLLQVMEDYGIEEFVKQHEDSDPDCWSTTQAILIEYEIKMPKKIEVVTKLEI